MEIWKDIEGYEGYYQISNEGRVKSLNYNKTGKEKTLCSVLDKYGYYTIGLHKEGNCKRYLVHRLVAEAFIPNEYNKPCIDHINTVRTDNRVENLKWTTVIENNNNPLTKIKMSKAQKGRTFSEESRIKMSLSAKKRCRKQEIIDSL